MNKFVQILAVTGLIAVSTQAFAVTPVSTSSTACQQIVDKLKDEWKAVDYSTPEKPTAMRVTGNYGHENTASQVNYMATQIKLADQDCKSGNSSSALQRVSSIHDIMDQHGVAPEVASAAMQPQQ